MLESELGGLFGRGGCWEGNMLGGEYVGESKMLGRKRCWGGKMLGWEDGGEGKMLARGSC